MGIALYRVWRRGTEHRAVRVAMAVFGVQLVLNAFWSYAFFQFESPLFGVVVLALLLFAIGLTIYRFEKVDRPAALLLIPYALWICFALALNFGIWQLNPNA
jgi:translocator protein